EALTEEAKRRGMPAGKGRGLLREYLQVLILKEIYRLPTAKNFCFTGGTYLRLVHRTKRFSEDLDFNTPKMSRADFERALSKVHDALKKTGFSVSLDFAHWQNMLVAELIFPDIEKACGVVSANARKEGIVIKVEVHHPAWNIKTETLVVDGFGQMFPVVTTDRGALFADKIDALAKKNRARHLYDILYMLTQKYSVDMDVLKTLGIEDPPFEVILKRVTNYSAAELRRQAESLRPFLLDEAQADLIVNAPAIVQQLIGRYR
ncbi:MAG: nucleotidyl transferase AbiEii/AbiGii toxin family protein, partial [Candidatus Omnitrophica bacterium]|nr:nucleotidyl transferase AbiEii/AbiGii toxin family protein [Candidatus Omnitrophota bacterium]